jgi:aminopeptidase N
MVALRGVLGQDLFNKAFKEYGRRWQYKHPTPYDFFDTFDDVSGRDLSWFWRTWFFETWRLDQSIDSVATVGDSVEIGIENRGRAPMPVPIVVTRADGRADSLTVPVDVWLGGAKRTTVRVAREPAVKSIEIDPGHDFPDVDRDNQRWPR